MRRGFSLVELSIVLVILGLLVGGVLSGQSLIRAAELRSITTQQQRWMTAIGSFRDKYFALPGDITNATNFWGTDPDGCPENLVRTNKTTTCNGNGNGLLDMPSAGVESMEGLRLWQQLALAGLIEGTYLGQRSNSAALELGVNVPKSALGTVGWHALYVDPWPVESGSVIFIGQYGNTFQFGTVRALSRMVDPAIKSQEAWNIDTKADDGSPKSGKIMTWKSGLNPGCTTSNSSAAANYDLASTAIACSLIFIW
jgi:prepilin-type N-terminal cleavage/methylation domain-containing protein